MRVDRIDGTAMIRLGGYHQRLMSGKIVAWVVGILALTAGIVCWCALPLIWDGAFQISVTLLRQHPFVYLTRFHTLILWQPTVWASHFTDNPWILQAIYGFPF